MKKPLLVVFAIALVLVVLWFRAAKVAVTSSAARSWPGGMGTLDSALDRYPPLHANDASRKLMPLANALSKSQAILLDPSVRTTRVETLRERIDDALHVNRFIAALSGSFSLKPMVMGISPPCG
jgi:hypothetical protein